MREKKTCGHFSPHLQKVWGSGAANLHPRVAFPSLLLLPLLRGRGDRRAMISTQVFPRSIKPVIVSLCKHRPILEGKYPATVREQKPVTKWIAACTLRPARAGLRGAIWRDASAAHNVHNAASTSPPKPSIVPFTHITRSVARVLLCWSWQLYSPYLLLIIVARVPLVSCLLNGKMTRLFLAELIHRELLLAEGGG